ncbi:MAG: ATP-binding cassette domain-containing protein [Acidimicrobiales bacterium]|nr:ATP-binding cassette domain-containing protein [Acidimicrobiales bacterium]
MTAAQLLGHDLVKSFDGHAALAGVDLALQGGLVAVLGPNGAGKTTLLRCLATVVRPDTGSLLIDGLNPAHESDRIEIRRRLGYQPQQVQFAGGARVFDVLDYLAVLKGFDDDRRRRHWVFHVLDLVGLRDRVADEVRDLSGGMRQRLGLAQALLGQPSLLLLDEPAAGVDPDERFRMRDLIAARRAEATVVLSTHLTDEAAVCDKILVLDQGRIRFVGSPSALAAIAAGRTWVQSNLPADDVRASWRQADGRYRCLGTSIAPPTAEKVAPTLEDGYLTLLTPAAP